MNQKTRNFLKLALACLASGAVAGAIAQQDYPSKAITLIVPYGPGGSTDSMARALGEQLTKRLGQPILIEYKPGAGGTLGAVQMVNAKPDGYYLSLIPLSVFRQPYLNKVQYDPMKDITYVSTVMNYSYAIAVPAASPWKDIHELVKAVKAAPNKYSYAATAQYSSNHLAMAELGRVAGLKWTFIPYKGDVDAITALLGGHVDIINGTSTIIPFVQSQKMRVLAVAGKERSSDYPGVPTLNEVGYPVVMSSPLGVGGPAGMPQAIVDKLDKAIKATVEDPDFIKQTKQLGIELSYRDHKTYTEWTKQTYAAEKTIIGRLAGE